MQNNGKKYHSDRRIELIFITKMLNTLALPKFPISSISEVDKQNWPKSMASICFHCSYPVFSLSNLVYAILSEAGTLIALSLDLIQNTLLVSSRWHAFVGLQKARRKIRKSQTIRE